MKGMMHLGFESLIRVAALAVSAGVSVRQELISGSVEQLTAGEIDADKARLLGLKFPSPAPLFVHSPALFFRRWRKNRGDRI
jgi:hypothetical protein